MADRESARGKKSAPAEEPPSPWEAQQTQEGVPMAVANDMNTIHGEGFVPTSAPLDPRANVHDADASAGPDVRPKGPDIVVDNDDPKLMPLHAGDTPEEAAEGERRHKERYHNAPQDAPGDGD